MVIFEVIALWNLLGQNPLLCLKLRYSFLQAMVFVIKGDMANLLSQMTKPVKVMIPSGITYVEILRYFSIY